MKLLPCPFCGAEAKFFHDTNSDYETYWTWGVKCTRRECSASNNYYTTQYEALLYWNNRENNEWQK